MVQLVKGGKNVYGWSIVGSDGDIVIPSEAAEEYDLQENELAIIMSGSRKSGGLILMRYEKLRKSSIAVILDRCQDLGQFIIPAGRWIEIDTRFYCWIKTGDKKISLPPDTLKKFGVNEGTALLSVRGSNMGIAFIVKGPIVDEAKKHPELEYF